jgi:hypothetical protein
VRVGINALIGVAIENIVECLCEALEPPCSPDPTDDRLILACMTVDRKNGKIVHICNHACRRHAGAFPSVKHWLSIVPILPLIGLLVEQLCCAEVVHPRKPMRWNRLTTGLQRIDPAYRRREAVAANNYAVARRMMAKATGIRRQFQPANLERLLADPTRVFSEIRGLFHGQQPPSA